MRSASDNGSKEKRRSKGAASEWIKNITPNKVIGDAQRILKTAVDVLEEEIAAGIVAAKKLEKKVINVEAVRSNDPEELMSRIRRDTHDAVDIFLDAITALTNHFTSLSQTTKNGNHDGVMKSSPGVQVVKSDHSCKPGSMAEIPILLTNDSPVQFITVELNKTDLTGQKSQKISARHITVEPASLVLPPAEKKEVMIKIAIPANCKPGTYSGFFQDNTDAKLRTIISIDVV